MTYEANYYPRLGRAHSLSIIREILPISIRQVSKISNTTHEMQYFYDQTKAVDQQTLEPLRKQIIDLALGLGFPDSSIVGAKKSEFDRAAAGILEDNLSILPTEAACDEVWNFITLVLLPDIAKWRYPNKDGNLTYERWLGSDRNVFRKLWWREATLGRELSNQLGEDQVVAIMERPRLGGNGDLARAIAKAYLQMVSNYESVPREKIMRLGAMNVRRRVPFLAFEVLDTFQLDECVLEIFEESTSAYDELLQRERLTATS